METLPQQIRDCFVCDKSISSCSDSAKVEILAVCKRFLKLASRYLSTSFGVEPEKTLIEDIDFKNSVDGLDLDCCEDCLLKVQNFCRLYDQWIQIKLGLDHSSKEIADTMMKVKTMNLKRTKIENDEISHFKKSFVKRVEARKGRTFPRIELERVPAPALALPQEPILTSNDGAHDDIDDIHLIASTIEIVSDGDDDASISNMDMDSEPSVSISSTPKDNEAPQSHCCGLCGKTFSYLSSLRRHKKVHLGIKPFKCTYCDSKFTENQTRLEHERIHTGETPFKCKICGQSFKQRSQCQSHEKFVHNPKKVASHAKKPFKCHICGNGFQSKSSQRRHLKFHTTEKSWECTYCGKAFALNQTRLEHEIHHTGELPYFCGFCEKMFPLRNYCRKHQRQEHMNLISKTNDVGNGVKNPNMEDGHHDVDEDDENEAKTPQYNYNVLVKCGQCPEMFRRGIELRKHIQRQHGDGDGVDARIKSKPCQSINKVEIDWDEDEIGGEMEIALGKVDLFRNKTVKTENTANFLLDN